MHQKHLQKMRIKKCKIMQNIAKTQQNYVEMSKIVQQIACKPKKLAQLEKICTDGVTRFLNLIMYVPWTLDRKYHNYHADAVQE